jgi:hypothetical protein
MPIIGRITYPVPIIGRDYVKEQPTTLTGQRLSPLTAGDHRLGPFRPTHPRPYQLSKKGGSRWKN